MRCVDCKYGETLVTQGTSYTVLNPLGQEVTRVHADTIMICRAMPPLGGSFPQVNEEDWCGHFESSGTPEAG